MNFKILSAAFDFRLLLTTALLAFPAGVSAAAASTALQLAALTAPWPSSQADALRTSAGEDLLVQRVYDATGWRLLWTDVVTKALQSSLGSRKRHGLDRAQFIEAAPPSASPAQRDIALTRSALRFAAALEHGMSDPATWHEIYSIPRPAADLATPLGQALAEGRLEAWLAGLAPQDDSYSRLSQAYLRESAQIGAVAPPDIKGGVIRIGDTDLRVAEIAAQLVADEYLAASSKQAGWPAPVDQDQPTDQTLYNQQLADAVKRLQRDYGIVADGVIGPDTLGVLNLRPYDRAQALAVALERLRWLSRTPPVTRIDVNTAASRLSYYRDGQLVDSRRVITGRAGKETPQLLAPIYRLVANPTWTIPKSIQNGEMAGVSNAYLRRHNMVRRKGWLVQKSGPSNALGLVKFDMNNKFAIYLHDTSAPSLFTRSQRHLSHGCVRVFDALAFAQMLAEDEGIAAEWQAARRRNRQTFVDLPREIPVRLIYQNVFIDGDGEIAFRTDPYGWNAPIAKALGFETVSDRRARNEKVDISP